MEAVMSMVMLVVLFTSILQVNECYFEQFYLLQKTLESSLTTEKTLYTMRQVFSSVMHTYGQEIQQVHIEACVHIAVDQSMNSSINASCIADKLNTSKKDNTTSLCWSFLWSDSALLSLITMDQLLVFDQVLVAAVYSTAIGGELFTSYVSLPIICPVMPEVSDIKTSLMLLLSWSKSYIRYKGVPPQWEERDRGYIQELHHSRWLAESTFEKSNNGHLIRQSLTITFALLNMLIMIALLSFGKQCYIKVCQSASGSTKVAAVIWAFMTTVLFINVCYFLFVIMGFARDARPKAWACVISKTDWCDSVKSMEMYSDEVATIVVKLIVIPFVILVELITAVRLTSHTLLLFPCAVAVRPQNCYLKFFQRIFQTILIWNLMVFIQIIFGVALLPVCIAMVIAPGATISVFGVLFILIIELTGFITYFILQWCSPISIKHCVSATFCAHLFISVVIFMLSVLIMYMYYSVVGFGVQPWSVERSILSLLPSFLVPPLLWLAKRYFFKDLGNEEVCNQLATHLENGLEEERRREVMVRKLVNCLLN